MRLYLHFRDEAFAITWLSSTATFQSLLMGFVEMYHNEHGVYLNPATLDLCDTNDELFDFAAVVANVLVHKDQVFVCWKRRYQGRKLPRTICNVECDSFYLGKRSSMLCHSYSIERIARLYHKFGNKEHSHVDNVYCRGPPPKFDREEAPLLLRGEEYSALSSAMKEISRLQNKFWTLYLVEGYTGKKNCVREKHGKVDVKKNNIDNSSNNNHAMETPLDRIERLRKLLGERQQITAIATIKKKENHVSRVEDYVEATTPLAISGSTTIRIQEVDEDDDDDDDEGGAVAAGEEEEEEEEEDSDDDTDNDNDNDNTEDSTFDDEDLPATTYSKITAQVHPSVEYCIQASCCQCSTVTTTTNTIFNLSFVQNFFYTTTCDSCVCPRCSVENHSGECPKCAHLFPILKSPQSKTAQCVICGTRSAIIDILQARTRSYSASSKSNITPKTTKANEIHLIQQYYTDKDEERQREVDLCLKNNVENKFIRHIHMLTEKPMDFRRFGGGDKIVQYVVGRWLRYSDMFSYANRFLQGRVVIFANSDIHFDDTLGQLQHLDMKGRCFAVTRHDARDGQLVFDARISAVSQDAWIFESPLPTSIDADFCIGKPGCDNRIAYELRKIRLRVTNPAAALHAVHLHASEKRNYVHGKDTIVGNYAAVIPCPRL